MCGDVRPYVSTNVYEYEKKQLDHRFIPSHRLPVWCVSGGQFPAIQENYGFYEPDQQTERGNELHQPLLCGFRQY